MMIAMPMKMAAMKIATARFPCFSSLGKSTSGVRRSIARYARYIKTTPSTAYRKLTAMIFHSMIPSGWRFGATAGAAHGVNIDFEPGLDQQHRLTRCGLCVIGLLGLIAATVTPPSLAAQDPVTSAITNDGVVRASAAVDSVFLDRQLEESSVSGGDWAAYLMARLGVRPIPASLGFVVTVDSERLQLAGRIRDLPPESRMVLGPVVGLLDSETTVRADITLHSAGPSALRFRLDAVYLGGVLIPDGFLQGAMTEVGRQVPVLTPTGRDLLVEIPLEGRIALLADEVRLIAPPQSPQRPKGTKP